jgi:hypothetical protein
MLQWTRGKEAKGVALALANSAHDPSSAQDASVCCSFADAEMELSLP